MGYGYNDAVPGAPTFADLDGDNDFDLVVSMAGVTISTSSGSSLKPALVLFTNIGNSTFANFKADASSSPVEGISQESNGHISSAFGDVDQVTSIDVP